MYKSGFHGRGQDDLFHDTHIMLKAPRMDEITKGETKAGLWGLQYLCDRKARRNQKRRLRMSSQRKKSWACGIPGVE